MYKKTLLTLAVASSLGLSGCLDDADSGARNADPDYQINNPDFTDRTWPLFNPITSQVPVPSDLNFDQEAADGSFGVAGDMTNPVIGALNNLSGASTVAPAVVRMNGDIDIDSVDSRAFVSNPAFDPSADPQTQLPVIPNPNQNIFLIELAYASGEPVRALSAGEPPTIPLAITFQLAAGLDPLGTGTDLQGRDRNAAIQHLTGLASKPAYDHDVLELNGDSAVRVRPNKPLNPLSRYVVVVTDGITDINGDAIVGSPSYQSLGDENQPLGNSALAPVKTLITSFWENIGSNYFALNNSSRAGFGLPALDKDNIALSYSFTTSEDKKVLSHIGNPANWLADQLKRSVTLGAAGEAVQGGADDFGTVFGSVQTALATYKPSEALANDGLIPCDTAPYDAGPFGTFDDQFLCVGTLIKGAVGVTGTLDDTLNSLGLSFPQPSARTISLEQPADALSVSAVLSSLTIPAATVDVHQGSISLPQYIAVPDGTQTGPDSAIRTKSWRPDVALAGVLGEALGATLPQENPEVSKVLNYIYPFPKKEGDVKVPMLVITPKNLDPENLGEDLIPVIFQHGITTDRSAALTFGSQLVASAKSQGVNLAVFAIDQPLHGVAPFTKEDQEELALTLLVAGGVVDEPAEDSDGDPIITSATQETIDAVVSGQFPGQVLAAIALGLNPELNQSPDIPCSDAIYDGLPDGQGGVITGVRSFDAAVTNVFEGQCDDLITGAGADPVAAPALGSSFSLDNTVANAGSTIPGLAPASTATGVVDGINERHYGYTAGSGNNPIAMDFEDGVGSSGSLFINLTNFMNSRDILRQGSIDLMNLTATINGLPGVTKDGVHFIGHSLGTLNGGAFVGAAMASGNPALHVRSAHLLTPVAGTTRLLENSPSFAPTILGGLQAAAGLTQGDADLETFLNVNQAALDAVDPINFYNELALSNTVLAQVEGDRTTPNAADTRYGADKGPLDITFPNGLTIDSPAAPLSGSEALAAVMGAKDTAIPLDLPMITRYANGVHSTPVLPTEVIAESGDVLKNRTIAQGEEVIVSEGNAAATFETMIRQNLLLINATTPASQP